MQNSEVALQQILRHARTLLASAYVASAHAAAEDLTVQRTNTNESHTSGVDDYVSLAQRRLPNTQQSALVFERNSTTPKVACARDAPLALMRM